MRNKKPNTPSKPSKNGIPKNKKGDLSDEIFSHNPGLASAIKTR